VQYVKPPLCPLCGRPHPTATLCASCRRQPLQIDGIRSVALFEGALRKAIHAFKYSYVRELAGPLGDLLIGFWEMWDGHADIIVPVPLHRRRQRERGYNQAGLLARRLGLATGVSVWDDVLERKRHTISQTGLGGQARRENVRGAFACLDSSVQDKRVLLIDDVCTTGATLEACSTVLKEAGARTVWALTVARAARVETGVHT